MLILIRNFFLITSIFAAFSLEIVAQDTSLEFVENHNSWGWDAWVMQNGLIQISTIPVIGARIMEYSVGGHESIFVNPSELGKTYDPESFNGWPNFGGFKNWPAPQDNWGWPPPPILDFGSYSVTDTLLTVDSLSISVESQIEKSRTPNLRFQRTTTMYSNSSRVRVDQTIINEGASTANWSIWDVTQNIVNHPGETDFENFMVYFPINPESLFGESGVKTSASSSAWRGEVAPGVYGVEFKPEAKKIFADSHIGWIAYIDDRDDYLYAKTFEIDEQATYPDDGARVEVWVNNDPYYLEVEVLSPVVSLPANGGSYTFTEDWWASKIEGGPILSVNNVGVVTRFEYLEAIGRLSASFGVFHTAFARLEYLDSEGAIVTVTDTVGVSPLETFTYDEPFSVLEGVDSVRMVLLDATLNHIGILVTESIEILLTSNEQPDLNPTGFELSQNYPNPFNPSTNISYVLPQANHVTIEVFNMLGKSVGVIEDSFKSSGSHSVVFDGSSLSSGIYTYQITTGEFIQVKKMVLVK